MTYRKKLIEAALPLEAINAASARVTRHCEEPKPRAKRGGQRRSTATPATSTRSEVLAVATSNLATEEIEL